MVEVFLCPSRPTIDNLRHMFKLDFDIPQTNHPLNIKDKIYCIGSCFSDNIGDRLGQYKFQILSNPFGTLFNPHSIFKLLGGQVVAENIVENDSVFYHWDTHSSLSSLQRDELVALIHASLEKSKEFLKAAQCIVITFGTSFVYTHKDAHQIVANCHKIPQLSFNKRLLTPQEIVNDYEVCLNALRNANPNLRVLLTVSPVRHIKDGLHENNISKGILHESIHQIIEKDRKAEYFPSYEIMIDELRDYRFYKEDRIHPNDEAIDYIWSRFTDTFIDKSTRDFINKWSQIIKSIDHKAFHPTSESHQNFLKKLRAKIKNFEVQVDVAKELNLIDQQIIERQ